MTSNIVLNNSTKLLIEAFVKSSSHAALIEAPEGAGKSTVLKYIAQLRGANRPEYFIEIDEHSRTISIDEIRELKRRLKLKNKVGDSYAVLISNAERLTIEAQNAFLKLLEEPPEGIVFLLSSRNRNMLLPTIVSRCMVLPLLKPEIKDVQSLLTSYSEGDIKKALALSEGWPGLAVGLLSDETGSHSNNLNIAKELLSMNELQKLKKIDLLIKDKSNLPKLLFALERVLHSGLHMARKHGKNIEIWQKKLAAVESAQNALMVNVSTRLLLCKLMLSL